VDSITEGKVLIDLPVNVETVWVGELAIIPVGGGGNQEQCTPRWHCATVVFHVLRHVPGVNR
jgi:hypothetical protein